ncbi:MAG: murein biosynthesis integral membrane protein MurJ [Candidatus Binataceae bacterium]
MPAESATTPIASDEPRAGKPDLNLRPPGGSAGLVASGILLSRIAGLIRESIFAHFFGISAVADALKAGFRIPNILLNLLGEGVLSASFIPVYSKMLGDGDEDADLLAWAVGAVLALAVSMLVALGIAFAPYLIEVIAPGFAAEKRELTIHIVRVLFPGIGLLVMSMWCLGVLNSHHRFFASYVAPVFWNLTLIATLLFLGPYRTQDTLAIDYAWGSVAGSALMVLVQLPQVLALMRRRRLHFRRIVSPLRTVFSNLAPVVGSKGVAQISGYIDNILASLLPTGAVAALGAGQIFYLLPVSLFGLSVAASELPTMSRASGTVEEIGATLRMRLNAGLRQIAFLIIPSAAAFMFLGDVIVALVFQSGHFSHDDAVYVWAVLAGSSIGMLATTMVQLYNNAFYSLLDTRTPLRYAIVRVTLTLILGYLCAIPLPPLIGIAQRWGVAGLTASAGVSGWVEFTLLRWKLNQRIGQTGLKRGFVAKLWAIAIGAAAIAFAFKLMTAGYGPRLQGLIVLPIYGVIYLGMARTLKMPEFDAFVAMVRRRFTR